MKTTEGIYDKDHHKIGELYLDNGDVEIEIESQYFCHHIRVSGGKGFGEYIIKKAKVEILFESEEESKTYSDGEITKDLYEGVVSIMIDLANKNQNIVTRLYDENGNDIGSLEEGMDTWLQLMLETKNCPRIKIWHYPNSDKDIKNKIGKKLEVDVAGKCLKMVI